MEPDSLIGPFLPGLHAEMPLEGHEQGVVVQPEVLRGAELGVGGGGGGQQPGGGFLQDHRALVVERAVIDAADRGRSGHLAGQQPAFVCQGAEIDEIGVPGKGGKALVGAVAVAGGADG